MPGTSTICNIYVQTRDACPVCYTRLCRSTIEVILHYNKIWVDIDSQKSAPKLSDMDVIVQPKRKLLESDIKSPNSKRLLSEQNS